MRLEESFEIGKRSAPEREIGTPYKASINGMKRLLYRVDLVMKYIMVMGEYLDLQDNKRDLYRIPDRELRKRRLEKIHERERKIGPFYHNLDDALRRMKPFKEAFKDFPEYKILEQIYENLSRKKELRTNRTFFENFAERSLKVLYGLKSELSRNVAMAEYLERRKEVGSKTAEAKQGGAVAPITTILIILGLTGFFLVYLGYSVSQTSAAISFSPVVSVFPFLFTILVVVGLYLIYRK